MRQPGGDFFDFVLFMLCTLLWGYVTADARKLRGESALFCLPGSNIADAGLPVCNTLLTVPFCRVPQSHLW